MPLPDIDFRTLRDHHGDKPSAFEELCCQLAGDEPLPEGREQFVRKGRGADGGVECFAIHPGGKETCWQVKYYWDTAAAIRSLDESLTQALDKHPEMERFIGCIPIDLADSRQDEVRTALQRWNAWKAEKETAAASAGRALTIDRWDAYEIKSRLTDSNPKSAGRIAFWFNQTLLTPEWFRERLNRTIGTLGKRYSPEAHVALPIRRAIAATVCDPDLFRDIKAHGDAISARLGHTAKPEPAATAAVATAVNALKSTTRVADAPGFIADIRAALDPAEAVVLGWFRTVRAANSGRHPTAEETAVSNLLSAIGAARRELRQTYWDRLDSRRLLVVGEAGTGKSHLLADACDDHLKRGRPALMFLGGKLPDAEPWGEVLRELDLPGGWQVKQFLGALNAAGQAAGIRCLIAIDALNEKNGQSIWPERLTGLLHDVAQFEWIAVVLSCRSTYEDIVIPPELDEATLPRVKHEGFSISEARRYLKKRGVSLAEEPNPVEELENPLFLRICCDALADGGQALLSNGLGGVTETFDLYTKSVVRRVQTQLNTAPARAIPEKVLAALAQEMAATGLDEIPTDRAYALAAPIFAVTVIGQDPLFQLENEGLLARDPGVHDGGGDVVRFTFQRMSDHAIASSLIERSITSRNVSTACAPASPFFAAITQKGSRIKPGLFEALAVQLPERFGVELHDLPALPPSPYVSGAFQESLLTRKATSFTARTWELVEKIGGDTLRYETLIALSTNSASAYSAKFLDQELRGLPMAKRDALWSAFIAADSAQASYLVDWVREADQTAIHAARAELAAIQLCWFLTTSSRTLRDTATKGLVALLSCRAGLARSLWHNFRGVDDPYLTERLAAAVFGAAMQSCWAAAELAVIADELSRDVLMTPVLPANSLTRDHVRGLVRYADVRGALPPGLPLKQVEPPYASPWPLEYVTEAEMESYERTYPGGHRSRDEIASSCVFDGDFARYVIDYAVRDWSVAPRGAKVFPTSRQVADRWLVRFGAVATAEMRAAHDRLVSTSASAARMGHSERDAALKAAKAAFRAAVGEQVFAEWRGEAENWRSFGMYQSGAWAMDDAAQFNLAWARRWVCKRAHDLGWSEALHGQFDRSIASGRQEHKLERIGKKYQWIALSELCARLADHLEPLPGRNLDSLERLRNIDPSMLISQTEDDGWRSFEEPSFWVPPAPLLQQTTVDEALAWLSSDSDYFDAANNVEVTDLETGRRWLVLKGFESWRGGGKALERETWRRVASVVVAKEELAKLQKVLENFHLQGSDDLPTAKSGGYRSYIGEHPWSWRRNDPNHDEWETDWRPYGSHFKKGVSIRATTADYLAESSGYDGSLDQNINLYLPAGWLMDALELSLSDGATIRYHGADGVVCFMDPSVSLTGRSAALVDRDAFLGYLEKQGLAVLWSVSGEKNVYGESPGDGFGGRWTFTRLFHSMGGVLTAGERYATFDAPGAAQLAALRKAEV